MIKIFRPQRLNNGGTSKFRARENAAGGPERAAVSTLGQLAQLRRIRLPSLD